jgi:hypothetical protein
MQNSRWKRRGRERNKKMKPKNEKNFFSKKPKSFYEKKQVKRFTAKATLTWTDWLKKMMKKNTILYSRCIISR